MASNNGTTDGRRHGDSGLTGSHDGDEASPLLPNGGTPSAQEETAPPAETFTRRNLVVSALVIFTLIIIEFGTSLQVVPLISVYESIICRNFGVSPDRCGEDADVQSELAFVRGWTEPLELLPGKGASVLDGNRCQGSPRLISGSRPPHGCSVRLPRRQVRTQGHPGAVYSGLGARECMGSGCR